MLKMNSHRPSASVGDGDDDGARSSPRNAEQNVGDLDALAAALATIPKAEHAAVVDHVAALANLSPEKRAALMTLST